jgi:hypothetical protein
VHKTLISLTLVAAATTARADGPTTEAIVRALEHRNAAAEAAFTADAAANRDRMTAKADEVGRAATLRAQADREVADDFAERERRSHRHASIKTGLILGTIGVACLAGGLASWTDASSREDAIATGGYTTGTDISDDESMIQVEQGTAFGTWSVGGVLTLTALGYLW